MDLTIESVHANRREGRVEVSIMLANDDGVAVGVNLLKFTHDEWGNAMAELLTDLVRPHIEELYLKYGVPVNGLGQEDETWKALIPQLAMLE